MEHIFARWSLFYTIKYVFWLLLWGGLYFLYSLHHKLNEKIENGVYVLYFLE